MSAEWAIVIAALISGVSTVSTFLLNLFFNKSINKKISEEKFFYSVFEKRLELYNEFVAWLKEFPNDIIAFLNSKQERSTNSLELFEKKNENTLVYFELKAMLLGDNLFADKCHQLIDSFLQEIINQLGFSDLSMFDVVNLVVGISTDKAYNFVQDFSEESFPVFLDSFVKRYVDSAIPESKSRAKMNKEDIPNSKGDA